ncbi:MAG: hypothetical protein R2911_24615 [Caldilineaceae bacterium]
MVVDSPGSSVYASDGAAGGGNGETGALRHGQHGSLGGGYFYLGAHRAEITVQPAHIDLLDWVSGCSTADKLAADYGVEAVVYKSGVSAKIWATRSATHAKKSRSGKP